MKKIMVVVMIALPALAVSVAAARAADGGNAQAGKSQASTCESCHGTGGNSIDHATPKLAQQVPQYLVKQLQDFKSGARKSPIMSTMAAMLQDQAMQDVAAYFSQQKMSSDNVGDKALAEQGGKIYSGGVAAASVPACASCHGPKAVGVAPAYPRLAGQHAQYLVAQLQNFKSGTRANDKNQVMRDIASKLTDGQMKAVADYLAGL